MDLSNLKKGDIIVFNNPQGPDFREEVLARLEDIVFTRDIAMGKGDVNRPVLIEDLEVYGWKKEGEI